MGGGRESGEWRGRGGVVSGGGGLPNLLHEGEELDGVSQEQS